MIRNALLTMGLAAGLLTIPAIAATYSTETIRQAQQALKAKGYDPGPADGVNGPKTHSALMDYQKSKDLKADGRLGDATLKSLGLADATVGSKFDKAGKNVKTSYGTGGKDIGEGSKSLGENVKHGEVTAGAKDFGKGVGHGAAKMGVGTGHAAKNVAKGVKDAFTDDRAKKPK